MKLCKLCAYLRQLPGRNPQLRNIVFFYAVGISSNFTLAFALGEWKYLRARLGIPQHRHRRKMQLLSTDEKEWLLR